MSMPDSDGDTDVDEVEDWKDTPHTENRYIVLPDDATPEDVEYGRRYWAYVNNTEHYGVFVALNRADDWDAEVSGLVHKSNIPGRYMPDDFAQGDEVGVMLNEVKDNGDLNFEMVAGLKTMRDHEFEADPTSAPTGAVASAIARHAGEGEPRQATVADETDEDILGQISEDTLTDDEAPEELGVSDDERLAALESELARQRVEADQRADDLARSIDSLGDGVDALRDLIHDTTTDHATDAADADEWPGRYGLAVSILREHADDGHDLSMVDYAEGDDETTLKLTITHD